MGRVRNGEGEGKEKREKWEEEGGEENEEKEMKKGKRCKNCYHNHCGEPERAPHQRDCIAHACAYLAIYGLTTYRKF